MLFTVLTCHTCAHLEPFLIIDTPITHTHILSQPNHGLSVLGTEVNPVMVTSVLGKERRLMGTLV